MEDLDKRKVELKILLIKRDISQKELAKKLKINFATLNQYINGWVKLKDGCEEKICKELSINYKAYKKGKIKEEK